MLLAFARSLRWVTQALNLASVASAPTHDDRELTQT